MKRATSLFIITILLGLNLGLSGQVDAPKSAKTPIKIGVIGASVSAGFGSDYTLSEAIAAAVKVPVETTDFADNFFFSNYKSSSPKSVAKMKAKKVDVIVALDYLFWFASGKKTLEERKEDISAAIGFLDGVTVPVLVGTVPEMRNVSRFMLRKDRIIPAQEVVILNQHLKDLIATKKNIHLLPLATWIECLNEGKHVPGMEHVSDEKLKKSDVFIADGLHLNRKGLVFGAAMIVKQLQDLKVKLNKDNSTHLVNEILARLAKNESTLVFEARGPDGGLLTDGTLRLKVPGISELMNSGFTMGELVKLRSLDKYNKPISLKNNNPVKITGLPPAAAKLSVRVRAEGVDGAVGAWKKVALKAGNKKPHVLVLGQPYVLKIRFVGETTGKPVAGVKVLSKTEARNLGIRVRVPMPEGFSAHAVSDADGKLALTQIAPESQTLVVTTPSLLSLEKTVSFEAEESGYRTIKIPE